MQLLEPGRYIWLLKALYGLLMLLPQVCFINAISLWICKNTLIDATSLAFSSLFYTWSSQLLQQSAAFKILRTRLKTVPSYSFKREQTTHALSENNVNEDPRYLHNGIDFASWLQRFEQMQKQHREHLKSQTLSRNSSISSKVCPFFHL